MLIAEELLLSCIDDGGRPRPSRSRLSPALGAALLVELVLRERISITPRDAGRTRRGRVELISEVPTDDAELDWVLEHLQTWTDLTAKQLVAEVGGPFVVDRLADRLVACGVLACGPESNIRTWPTLDPAPAREIRFRVHSCLAEGAVPTERTVALISLLERAGRLQDVVRAVDPQADLKSVRRRAQDLARGDWAATAVRGRAVTAAISTAFFGGRGGA